MKYEYNCIECGGFVPEPNKPYGYAGKYCYCKTPTPPPMPNNTKKEKCPKCHGTGSYQYDENHGKICEVCCKHDKGFFELQEHYGVDNGKMCCKAGCGYTRVKTQKDLKEEVKKSSKVFHDIIDKAALEAFSSPQSPLSEERWCAKALNNLKEARLEAQRELLENMIKDFETPVINDKFIVQFDSIMVKFLKEKGQELGLLPKITE